MRNSDEEIFVPLDASESRSFGLLRTDNELFNDEAHVVEKTVGVRRVDTKRRPEQWEILEDGEVVLLMKGTRFTRPEKTFLRGAGGMRFLIQQYKAGIRSVVRIKEQMKELL